MYAPKYPDATKAPLAMLMEVVIIDRRMDDDFDREDTIDAIGVRGGDDVSNPTTSLTAPPRVVVMSPPPPIRGIVDRLFHLLLRGWLLPPLIAVIVVMIAVVVAVRLALALDDDVCGVGVRCGMPPTPVRKTGDDAGSFAETKPMQQHDIINATTLKKAGDRMRWDELRR